MRSRASRLSSLAFLVGFMVAAPAIHAKDKKSRSPLSAPKDEIEVAGHIASTGGPVRSFLATQHYSGFYLYAQHDAGKTVTLIDVTKTDQPAVLGEIASAPNTQYNHYRTDLPGALRALACRNESGLEILPRVRFKSRTAAE